MFTTTDESLGKLPADVLTAIDDGHMMLEMVLAYHVSPKEVDPRKVTHAGKIETLAGQSLFLNRDRNGPMVNQSEVKCEGYSTANGLVWLIDTVLLPHF